MSQEDTKLTTGMKLVGIDFNPSGKTNVIEVKQAAADLIDAILRNDPKNETAARFITNAIDNVIIAQMLAVKGLTYKY